MQAVIGPIAAQEVVKVRWGRCVPHAGCLRAVAAQEVVKVSWGGVELWSCVPHEEGMNCIQAVVCGTNVTVCPP